MIADTDEDLKRREYLKQQLRLKTRTKSNVAMSADDMIENLLSRKEIFRKKTEVDADASSKNSKIASSGPDVPQLPLFGGKPLPPLYLEVWNCVRSMDTGLADTSRVSALLMTSGLTPQTLAYIWALVNRTVAGYLTQTELYATLALVSLAQSGYSFTSCAVVNQLKEPPLPRLDLRVVPITSSCTTVASTSLQHVNPPMFPSHTSSNPPTAISVPTLAQAVNSSNNLFPGASLLTFQSPSTSQIDDHQALQVTSTTTASPIPSTIPTVTQTLSSTNVLNATLCNVPSSSMTSSTTGPTRLSTLSALDLELISSSTQFPNAPLDPIFGDFQSSLTLMDNPLPPPVMSHPSPPSCPPPTTDDDEFDDFKSADLPPVLTAPVMPSISTSTSSVQVEDLLLPPATIPSAGDLLHLFDSPAIAGSSNETPQRVSWSGEEPEIGGVPNEDRYSALRSLAEDNVEDNSVGNIQDTARSRTSSFADEFGDFVDAVVPQSSSSTLSMLGHSSPSIQEKCIEACTRVLQSGLSLFESLARDEDLLAEVTSSTPGSNYMEDLVEVFYLCERLIKAVAKEEVADAAVDTSNGNGHKDSSQDNPTETETCDKIPASVIRLQNIVLPKLKAYLVKVIDLRMEEEDGPVCGVCLQSRGPAHVRYGLNSFHAPCANFYLNCVDNQLPIAPNIALTTS
ncbi:hypothetical protein AAG570_000181 [Ranatra chinensis]|uniref:EH domain-containing protein n=1 Tax=Ranatra chinensis TaxID=642074 RepID=A0ABD0ZJM9_9HEMI